MEIRMIETFLKIVQFNSFTKAAEDLGYVQSTVTGQIKQLEEELGIPLFERIGNRIKLTEAGEKFTSYAYELSAMIKQAKTVVSEDNNPSGSLKIGAVDSLCSSIMPKLVKEYSDKYNQVRISLEIASSVELEQMIKNGQIDAALYIGFNNLNGETILSDTYIQQLVVVGGSHNLYADRGRISVEEMSEQKMILTEKECQYHKVIMQLFQERGYVPDILLETGSTEIIKKFVQANTGISLLPEITVLQEIEKGDLIKLDTDIELPNVYIQIAVHKNKWKSIALEKFLEIAREHLLI
jgi:Transcriptional regulator